VKSAIYTVPGVPLDPAAGLRREPSRKVADREPGFEAKFDDSTLFFDLIHRPELRQVRIVAPPLLNLQRSLQASRLLAVRTGTPLKFKVVNLDRQSQILVDIGSEPPELAIEGALGRYRLAAAPADDDLFAGHRTVFSLSKNNDLIWIKDWLEYYRGVHGATAVLLYDNGSTAYSAEDLLERISSVRGVEVAVVVRWPFKHGPTGTGLKKHWDSNFSQLGMMEHARWRFLAQARSVLNCDIDELVVSPRGGSIFERVERSRSGIVSFHGDWVVGIEHETREPAPFAPMRFRDYRYVLRDLLTYRYGVMPVRSTRVKPKWALVPSRAPARARWHIHHVEKWFASRIMSKEFRFRHFREISKSWKYDRTRRDVFDAGRHVKDDILTAAFFHLGWIEKPVGVERVDRLAKSQLPSLSS